MSRLASLKHAFDWLLSHALLTPDRGGSPDQQASVTYFEFPLSARDGQQRNAGGPTAPVAPPAPFVTRAREETR